MSISYTSCFGVAYSRHQMPISIVKSYCTVGITDDRNFRNKNKDLQRQTSEILTKQEK